jgi:Tfp pilus assembly protein PilF
MPPESSTSQNAQPASGEPEREYVAASEWPTSSHHQGRTKAICVILFLLVVSLFLPTLKNDFVNLDDDVYVTANSHVRQGLTWATIKWSFHSTEGGIYWHPLTWLSHTLDWQLFGANAWGHHLTGLLLHALNAVLVFLVLQTMTGSVGRSLFVAALFGLHPTHVETAVWVAERKGLLSTLFWLLTMLAYARYTQERKVHSSNTKTYYRLALLSFTLGLMSKPMVVTLPFVLLLLDYWPLDRIVEKTGGQGTHVGRYSIGELLREKVPFFVMALLISVVTYFAQKGGGSQILNIAMKTRIENVPVACCRYIGKLFYPVNLCVNYPQPDHWPLTFVIAASGLLLLLSIVAFLARLRYPYFIVGWLWFLGTLVPVIGLVQVGWAGQSMADRYMYLSLIGLFIPMAWGVVDFTKHLHQPRWVLSGAAFAALAVCSVLTVRQISFWRNSGTLFRHAIAVTKDNWLAYNNLGFWLLGNGQPDEGMAQYRKAIETNPDYALAHNNLGAALEGKGQTNAAISEYRAAIKANPDYANAYYNLALLLQRNGRMDEAIDLYQKAINAQSDDVDAYNNLAIVLYQKGRLDDAIHQLQQVVKLRPDYSGGRCNLGNMLLKQGRTDEALAQFLEAVRLDPDNGVAHQNLANIYAQQGNAVEAAHHYQEVLRLTPNGPH